MRPRLLVVLATIGAIGVAALMLIPSSRTPLTPEQRARLQQLRNLGKAFYENPGTQTQAVDVLRDALAINPGSAQEHLNYGLALLRAGEGDAGIAAIEKAKELDPKLPHTYFNLGIEFKKRGDIERAIQEFEQMVELTPDEAKAQYNLGQLYRLQEDDGRALEKFELAAQLDPSLAAPHFQMFNMLRGSDMERARAAMEAFQRLKAEQQDSAVTEDVDWSFYAELYDPKEAGPPAAQAAMRFRDEPLPAGLSGAGGMILLDANGDRRTDLLAWDGSSTALLLNRDGSLVPAPDALTAVPSETRHVAAADANNDGLPELAWAGADGVSLLLNRAGVFEAGTALVSGDFRHVLWVDYDHDYDLDLLAVGADKALLRNNGDGTFLNVTERFPFDPDSPALAAAWAELFEDNTFDIVIAYADRVVHYDDRKMGVFETREIDSARTSADSIALDVVDYNNDGNLDIAVTSPAEGWTQILENHDGALRAGDALDSAVLSWADVQNRGWLDGVAEGALLVNQGTGDRPGQGFLAARLEPGEVSGLPTGVARLAAADFNADGLVDLAALDSGGGLHLLINETETPNQYVAISLEGVKSNKLAEGARVEVRGGRTYGKQAYQGFPLHFGLGSAERLETVRITWPNGLIQNETEQPAGAAYHYEEKPRLSGSCPMIYTWNGREFEYISEVLGVAPLGAGLGDGQFFPVDHDEYVWIDAPRLRERDGFYELRITEELREVTYLDQVKLIAVDHPQDLEIFTSEKFKSPPFPEFRLYGVRERIHPATAVDHRGRDILERIVKTDQRYADSFERDHAGRAERHSVTLDFPNLTSSNDMTLFLRGWVDWADASTITATGQNADVFFGPDLEVQDAAGNWVKADLEVGLPPGHARTIAVDLRGAFPADSRRLRISTNLCVFWDEIFAATATAEPVARLSEMTPAAADLRFRGFAEVEIHPDRRQAERFNYARVRPTSMWNPTPGLYTRYGDVRELLATLDDLFMIMGAGDEVALRFPADALPALRPGWQRNFLLFVDGWAKENDANTAFGNSVEPLPFHEMSGYPYGPGESYPNGPVYQRYRRDYNDRPALRLIRPLEGRSGN